MMKRSIIILSLFFCFTVFAGEDSSLYSEAVKLAYAGNADFAFINFHRILNLFPESKFYDNALFAAGEYYFSVSGYYEAGRIFSRYISRHPKSKVTLVAWAYLFEIARRQGNEEKMKEFRREIVTFHQLSFIFRDSKVYEYRSPLAKYHKVLYFIDKVEFYIDGKLFTQVTY